jgi:hypothetical protein
MHTVTANGATIPALGFGTFRVPGSDVLRIVPKALKTGFRLSTLRRFMAMKRKLARPSPVPALRVATSS